MNERPAREPLDAAAAKAPRLGVVTACNDRATLERNLMRSPMLAAGDVPVEIVEGAPSAAVAYNRGMDAPAMAEVDLVIFAHQDVFLPQGWDALLRLRAAQTAARDPDWAMLGCYGVAMDVMGRGPVWSSSIGAIVGRPPPEPEPVQSYDEMLMVMRRGCGLRFDESLPGFHMYGTDIVQEAAARGLRCYAAALPAIHNDGFHPNLGPDFAAAYHHVRRKWRARLPLWTPVTKVSPWGLALRRSVRANLRTIEARRAMAQPPERDPLFYAELCGWLDVTPSAAE
ncbi:hypothetical protein [Oceanicella actignis]|uniref:hypothetical protein n=1 Tax=Oceanicella actignis TaxID=1189325 RepID=UPI0011E7EE44|nr:hypothetical protein [Oceanicella actignis]TYO88750.1 GT2 family glycosyltransferase [Oceanicella actignis]